MLVHLFFVSHEIVSGCLILFIYLLNYEILVNYPCLCDFLQAYDASFYRFY